MNKIEKAEEIYHSLIGKKFQYIKYYDKIIFGFGDLHTEQNLNGEITEYAEYELYVRCHFRIINQNEIIFGCEDYMISGDGEYYIGWEEEPNFFEMKYQMVKNDIFKDNYVQSIELETYGNLVIKLNNIQIELFIASSVKENEEWKIWEHKK